jgi:hypothetical protein
MPCNYNSSKLGLTLINHEKKGKKNYKGFNVVEEKNSS